MRLLRAALVLLVVAGIDAPLGAQAKPSVTPSRDQVLMAAREIMTTVRFCTLITLGPDGQPQARVVDAFAPDSGLVVWIATNRLTRKVAEITRDPRVTLMYFSPTTFEYVTLIGTAVLDDDPGDKAAHWKPEWGKLYKDEFRGPDYLLIRMKPARLEVVSMKRGINNDPVNWRPFTVTLP